MKFPAKFAYWLAICAVAEVQPTEQPEDEFNECAKSCVRCIRKKDHGWCFFRYSKSFEPCTSLGECCTTPDCSKHAGWNYITTLDECFNKTATATGSFKVILPQDARNCTACVEAKFGWCDHNDGYSHGGGHCLYQDLSFKASCEMKGKQKWRNSTEECLAALTATSTAAITTTSTAAITTTSTAAITTTIAVTTKTTTVTATIPSTTAAAAAPAANKIKDCRTCVDGNYGWCFNPYDRSGDCRGISEHSKSLCERKRWIWSTERCPTIGTAPTATGTSTAPDTSTATMKYSALQSFGIVLISLAIV